MRTPVSQFSDEKPILDYLHTLEEYKEEFPAKEKETPSPLKEKCYKCNKPTLHQYDLCVECKLKKESKEEQALILKYLYRDYLLNKPTCDRHLTYEEWLDKTTEEKKFLKANLKPSKLVSLASN